jgi:hypothetical protein
MSAATTNCVRKRAGMSAVTTNNLINNQHFFPIFQV